MKLVPLYLILVLFISPSAYPKVYKVSSMEEFNDSVSLLKAGDRIVLRDGIWKDSNFLFEAIGNCESPVILEAETPGKVIITGNSSLKLSGEFLEVRGLWFKDGFTTEKSVISFRTEKNEFAVNSRITDCAITHFNPRENSSQYFYLELWGKNNRVDHNHFEGKTNQGPTLVVWLSDEVHRKNNHLIENNYFGERPELGRNGGETIRIGTSKNSIFSSFTTVQNNVFDKCNGESEIISNKSGNNCFRNNLFFESEGSLTLRHGNEAIVENNIFMGNGKNQTGGVRIINKGHKVRNNLFISLRGEEMKSPLVIMNGVPNSPLNRYHQVRDVEVQFNTFIDCTPLLFGAGKNEERTVGPQNTFVANNLFLNMKEIPFFILTDKLEGINFENNKTNDTGYGNSEGLQKINIQIHEVNGIIIPKEGTKELEAKIRTGNFPETDISGQPRTDLYVGAINPGGKFDPNKIISKAGLFWQLN